MSRMTNAYETVASVAQRARVSADTVRLWERRGLLRAIRTTSGVRLFLQRDVDVFLARRQKSAAPKRSP
jgi:DNA-binding transcriptional MerR regulator